MMSFRFGYFVSFFLHIGLWAFAFFIWDSTSSAVAHKPQEVFTVTLEGGQRIGGVSQVPTEAKNIGTPQTAQKASQEVAVKKEIAQPTVVDAVDPKVEAEKKKKEIEEAKKKVEQEKLKIEQAKKKEEEKKLADQRKKEADAKKQAEEAKQKQIAEQQRKEREAREKAEADRRAKEERDRKLAESIDRLSGDRTLTESANAGGQGVGAARIGGQGGGGGTLASIEFIAYRNELEARIKKDWRWISGSTELQVTIKIYLQPDGTIQDARIERSSGNSNFDDSALRAVIRANPVPPPPVDLYDRFKEVSITFNSHR